MVQCNATTRQFEALFSWPFNLIVFAQGLTLTFFIDINLKSEYIYSNVMRYYYIRVCVCAVSAPSLSIRSWIPFQVHKWVCIISAPVIIIITRQTQTKNRIKLHVPYGYHGCMTVKPVFFVTIMATGIDAIFFLLFFLFACYPNSIMGHGLISITSATKFPVNRNAKNRRARRHIRMRYVYGE